MITLCKTCGTSYTLHQDPPKHCIICEDDRQYVPATGQEWITPAALNASHTNKWKQISPTLLTLESVPRFAIGQRAFLVMTPEGNILWDCIANLDEATRTIITALGGLKAIAISHPHYYSTMQDWAEAFNAPVYLHADDRAWIMRQSPYIHLWEGESFDICREFRLLRVGGHFAGGAVLHGTQGKGMLLSGDIIQVAPGAGSVSFMWSYPNMLPLPSSAVVDIAQKLQSVPFDALFGAFAGGDIHTDANTIVQRSAQKYVDCLQGTAIR